ncbi:MAG: AMP-binding protein, partial [Candidatus Dormibacteraeota bacterium]|nr:AMP-binding protein [Candidatus Dormibacteraeota bacterium]
GVGEGDYVTIALPNGIEFIEACLAAWKLGAVPQPVSNRAPRLELEQIVELARPALLVGADVPGWRCLPEGYLPPPEIADGPLADRVSPSYKAPTSGGSTGRPKLIVSGIPAVAEAILLAAEIYRLEPDRVHLVTGPLYHNGPFSAAMGALFTGGHLVVMTRFDAATALALVERYRVDHMYLVPTMMLRIWKLDPAERTRHDLSSLRVAYHLAAPCPAWLKEAWIEWLGPERIWELYGGTEQQVITVLDGREWLAHRGSVGRPVRGGQIKILDAGGRTLPPGEVGEVFLHRAEGTPETYRYIGASARSVDGWESLGDMGYLDSDGYLYLTDRLSDMILVGGANVYPAEVEAALDEHPSVRSSCVIGLPDEELGNRVHAIVQAGVDLDDDELRRHLSERLAPNKIPRSFERTDQYLRDDAGKVRRSALRSERLVADR